jgi:hypothetical protein
VAEALVILLVHLLQTKMALLGVLVEVQVLLDIHLGAAQVIHLLYLLLKEMQEWAVLLILLVEESLVEVEALEALLLLFLTH